MQNNDWNFGTHLCMTTIPLFSCRRHRSLPRFDVKYCNNPSASVAQHNVGSDACVKSVTHNFPEAIKALLHPIASDAGKILRPHRIRKISVDKNAIQSSTNWVRLGLRCDTPIHSQQNIGKYIFRSFNSRILRVLSNFGLRPGSISRTRPGMEALADSGGT